MTCKITGFYIPTYINPGEEKEIEVYLHIESGSNIPFDLNFKNLDVSTTKIMISWEGEYIDLIPGAKIGFFLGTGSACESKTFRSTIKIPYPGIVLLKIYTMYRDREVDKKYIVILCGKESILLLTAIPISITAGYLIYRKLKKKKK